MTDDGRGTIMVYNLSDGKSNDYGHRPPIYTRPFNGHSGVTGVAHEAYEAAELSGNATLAVVWPDRYMTILQLTVPAFPAVRVVR